MTTRVITTILSSESDNDGEGSADEVDEKASNEFSGALSLLVGALRGSVDNPSIDITGLGSLALTTSSDRESNSESEKEDRLEDQEPDAESTPVPSAPSSPPRKSSIRLKRLSNPTVTRSPTEEIPAEKTQDVSTPPKQAWQKQGDESSKSSPNESVASSPSVGAKVSRRVQRKGAPRTRVETRISLMEPSFADDEPSRESKPSPTEESTSSPPALKSCIRSPTTADSDGKVLFARRPATPQKKTNFVLEAESTKNEDVEDAGKTRDRSDTVQTFLSSDEEAEDAEPEPMCATTSTKSTVSFRPSLESIITRGSQYSRLSVVDENGESEHNNAGSPDDLGRQSSDASPQQTLQKSPKSKKEEKSPGRETEFEKQRKRAMSMRPSQVMANRFVSWRKSRVNSVCQGELMSKALAMVADSEGAMHPERARTGLSIIKRVKNMLEASDFNDQLGRNAVERMFFDSIPKQHVEVKSVEQVLKIELLKSFLKKVSAELASIEVTFHGTREEYVDPILTNGLRPELCATGAYGRGAYVGTHAGVAHQYADPNADGWRHMCVLLVVVGTSVVKGQEGVQMDGTAVDRLVNPTQYCFVDSDRLYCTHLITYRVLKSATRRVGGGWDDPFQRKLQTAVSKAAKDRKKTGVR